MTDWSLPAELADVPGATELYDWFGYWPTFHDAELVDILLSTQGASWIRVYTCGYTGDVDSKGRYVQIKHITVKFTLEEVIELGLNDFSIQNVLNNVTLTKTDDAFQVEFAPVWGIAGAITAKRVQIALEPGILPSRPGFPNDV